MRRGKIAVPRMRLQQETKPGRKPNEAVVLHSISCPRFFVNHAPSRRRRKLLARSDGAGLTVSRDARAARALFRAGAPALFPSPVRARDQRWHLHRGPRP